MRVIDLLTKSQQAASELQGKDVMAFFGNTGAGKSTSIAHFMRAPLEMSINSYGHVQVRLKE
jgi:flagellar biosynthesis GTPase FlhF